MDTFTIRNGCCLIAAIIIIVTITITVIIIDNVLIKISLAQVKARGTGFESCFLFADCGELCWIFLVSS